MGAGSAKSTSVAIGWHRNPPVRHCVQASRHSSPVVRQAPAASFRTVRHASPHVFGTLVALRQSFENASAPPGRAGRVDRVGTGRLDARHGGIVGRVGAGVRRVRSSSTRSRSCGPSSRCSCCACCRSAASSGWADRRRWPPTCAGSPPPTAICGRRWRPGERDAIERTLVAVDGIARTPRSASGSGCGRRTRSSSGIRWTLSTTGRAPQRNAQG